MDHLVGKTNVTLLLEQHELPNSVHCQMLHCKQNSNIST